MDVDDLTKCFSAANLTTCVEDLSHNPLSIVSPETRNPGLAEIEIENEDAHY